MGTSYIRWPVLNNLPVASASMPNPRERISNARQVSTEVILKQVSTSDSQVLYRKLAHQPSALFPKTNQNENAVCAPNERVPYVTVASPALRGSRSGAKSAGSYSRSASS